MQSKQSEICIIEPFYGGSHKQLIDLITNELTLLNFKYDIFTMTSKKWHWRARCSSFYMSRIIPKDHKYRILFSSSVLPLAELIALRPDLAKLKKIVYFHENQIEYPVRKETTRNKNQIENKDQRDFQYGYNQILTSLVADLVLFNSNYNKTSFISNINSYMKKQPDYFISLNLNNTLMPKSHVIYFPINLSQDFIDSILIETKLNQMIEYLNHDAYLNRPISIIWPHRWEFDKNPEQFFNALFKLNEMNIDFRLHVIGEQFSDVPEIFNIAREKLKSKIITWGYLESKLEYYKTLSKCDLVISTANHEFFGVALIEACLFGVYPICPDRLVYPEIYPKQCLYSTDAQLIKKLKYICLHPKQFRTTRHNNLTSQKSSLSDLISSTVDKPDYFDKYKWKSTLKEKFLELFLS